MENDKLVVKTDYADEVYLDWEEVERLMSDNPLSVRFQTRVPIPEGVGIRDGDRIIVLKLETGGPIDLATIKSINQADLYVRGDVTLGGNTTSGNTNTTALNASTHWLVRLSQHKLTLNATFNRAEAEGQLTVENARGALRYDYFLTRSWFALVLQNLEQDTFQNLALRSTSTAGLGYEFLDFSSHMLVAGMGPTVVYTNFTTEPALVEPSATWFLQWYFEVYRDIVKLYHRHQGFRDLGEESAFRFNATQGVRVELFSDVNLNVEYAVRLNTKPAGDRKDLDTSLVFGLTYEYEH